MKDKVLNLVPSWQPYERYKSNLLNEVVDKAYDVMPERDVNNLMEELAKHIEKATGVQTWYFHNKDCSSWQASDHGWSFFLFQKKKPWWKRLLRK